MTEQEKLNHHNDPEGLLIAASEASHSGYLGDIKVVDGLLRQLVSDVIDRYEKVSAGEMEAAQASASDRQACIATASILAGNDRKYKAVAGWNGQPLADFIQSRTKVGEGDDAQTVIAHALAELVLSTYKELGSDDETEVSGSKLNASIHATTMMMLGVESND